MKYNGKNEKRRKLVTQIQRLGATTSITLVSPHTIVVVDDDFINSAKWPREFQIHQGGTAQEVSRQNVGLSRSISL